MSRLPAFGESPWHLVLNDYLEKNRQADGTLTVLAPSSATPASFTAINGSTNAATRRYSITGSGTVQQIAHGVEITGAAVGGTTAGRIAGYFGAQTGGGTGAGTANPIWGVNIITQLNAADSDAQSIGVELNVNNNKTDATSDLSGSVLKYGFSANSNGSKIASIGFNIGGAGQWRRGVFISQGAIATGGNAFDYRGDGANGPVTIGADSSFAINTNKFTVAASSGNTVVAGTLGVTGILTASGGVLINGGSFAAGKIYKASADGLAIGTITGSGFDLSFFNPAGSLALMRVPTGTQNFRIFGTMSVATGANPTGSSGIDLPACTSGLSSIRLPHGTAPSAPVNGDMWTTAAGGLFVQINGVTKTVTLT